MRNRFDKLAKNLGKEALGRSGLTSAHHEISPETQHADLRHEPDPARKGQRKRLGLLGRLASRPCLLEIYSHAPTAEELRACLAKYLAFWQERVRASRAHRRQRRRNRRRPGAFAAPSLWIIAAGVPRILLTGLELRPARGWPRGIYFFGGDILRVGLVVASKLPRTRDTLLVRLMAAGPLLAPAIAELAALPRNAHERAVAEHVLLDLQHVLSRQPSRTPKEKELMAIIRRSWEDARTEGRTEGRLETQAHALLTVLRVRGIPVPVADRRRILAEPDLQRLERWHERAVVATSIGEVLDGRGRARPSRTTRPAVHKERNGRRPLRASAPR